MASQRKRAVARVVIDINRVGQKAEFFRHGVGQGGWHYLPMIDSNTEELRMLRTKLTRIFLQEYFGVMPAKGKYDWIRLDQAVAAVLATGAKPIMAICFKPRVLFPELNDRIVHPNDYAAWDALIYEMVRHYNVEKKWGIEYWEVGNEPNAGEPAGCPYNFTPDEYCLYYEHTVRAILKADPAVKVGGPAQASVGGPILPALLEKCAADHIPLHFVSWHKYRLDPAEYSQDIRYVKGLLKKLSLSCETIIDEWNLSTFQGGKVAADYHTAFILETIRNFVENGLSYSCYYQIRDFMTEPEVFSQFLTKPYVREVVALLNYLPCFSFVGIFGLFDRQGTMRPTYFAFLMLSKMTGRLVALETDCADVQGFAAYDAEFEILSVVLWNFNPRKAVPRTVQVSIKNLNGFKWKFGRFIFDAHTASNDESQRITLVTAGTRKIKEYREKFKLPAYGITLFNFKKLVEVGALPD
jgi:beta-xylosidase